MTDHECIQEGKLEQMTEKLDGLCQYTGMDPMANGKSLRGQISDLSKGIDGKIDELRTTIRRATLFVCIAGGFILGVLTAAYWAISHDAERVQKTAKEVTTLANAVKAATSND